jgi:hypothetical protein
MNLFGRGKDTGEHPKTDAGKGELKDYKFNLMPNGRSTSIQLAGSDPAQETLASLVGEAGLGAFIAPRTIEEERTDAPMPVRFLADRRMSEIVGWVPRGLEPAVIEAMTRLEANGKSTRIPAEIVRSKGKLRVNLLMGATR